MVSWILALTTNHDTGIAVYTCSKSFSFGQVFCVNEERLNRKKLTRSFPSQAILADGKRYGKILLSSRFTPISLLNLFNHFYSKKKLDNQFSYLLNLYIVYQVLLERIGLAGKTESFFSRLIYSKKLGVSAKRILCFDHHQCHAASTYYCSGFTDALVITADMMGDGLTLTVSTGKNRKLQRIFCQTGLSGIGAFYSKITQVLGFVPNRHEGKVTGLAALARPNPKLLNQMKKLFAFRKKTGGFTEINYLFDLRTTYFGYLDFKKYHKEDVAASAQAHLEQEVQKFAGHWLKRTKKRNLCLAGGLFANVKLNQRLHELPEVDNIFIFPHMGDGGLAFGALMAYLKPGPFMLPHVYLGPEFSDQEILDELKKEQLKYQKPNDIEQRVASLLAEGKVVARFNGEMEFGPRALGNRSILYQATDRSVNDWLNKRLRRTEFMPFAPATLIEHADRCYKGLAGARHAAMFMTITFGCTDYMKRACPGVVHADGSARPQLVSRESNPSFYRIIEEYWKITGIPSIINTSFNMHEEPIVCTPQQAIATFKQGHLDYLAIGKYLVG